MNGNRKITDETMDALIEWVFCHWPNALEEKTFIHGIFYLTDEAIRDAIAEERQRIFLFGEPSPN